VFWIESREKDFTQFFQATELLDELRFFRLILFEMPCTRIVNWISP